MKGKEPAEWLAVSEGRTGIFLTRNKKFVVFADPITDWHINKYGLTHWLYGVPPTSPTTSSL